MNLSLTVDACVINIDVDGLQVWYRVIQIVINRDDVQGYAAKTVFEVGSCKQFNC